MAKGLALDTPLPTPTGWVRMGDVQVGDTLFDEQGQPCTVTALSEINRRPCYRLTFDDGSSIVADDVHRWVTFDAKGWPRSPGATRSGKPSAGRAARAGRPATSQRPSWLPSRPATRCAAAAETLPPPTGTMRDTTALRRDVAHCKQPNQPRDPRGRCAFDAPAVDLPVPPYTLGAWLGDGASRNGQITGIDPEIWQRIEADGFEVRHYERDAKQHSIIGLKVKLRDLGVLENKHIPVQYLRASVEQRLAPATGPDGCRRPRRARRGCEFDGVREQLVDGVLELARSLGIKATKQSGKATLNGRVVGAKYRVNFTTSMPVFGLQRKVSRLRTVTRRTSAFRYLVACEPVESVPTRCISVDSPTRQYLAGEAMIPTHNTDLIVGLSLNKHKRVLVLRRETAHRRRDTTDPARSSATPTGSTARKQSGVCR